MRSFKSVYNEVLHSEALHEIKGEELTRLRRLFLETYADVARVCEKHGLTPMLCGGSALGAVRHKGFIPWDDDLDFAMTRADFEQFKAVFDAEFGGKYILNAPNYSPRVSNRFAKILIPNTRFIEAEQLIDDPLATAKIDLFIIENVPDNAALRFVKGMVASALMFAAGCAQFYEARNCPLREYMMQTEDGAKQFRRRAAMGRLFSVLSSTKWLNLVDRACRYRKATSRMGIPTGRAHYFGEILPREAFVPVSHGEFEGMRVALPADTNAYLANLFGDYMTVPPVEKRENHRIVELKL